MSATRRLAKPLIAMAVFTALVLIAACLLNHLGTGAAGVGIGPAVGFSRSSPPSAAAPNSALLEVQIQGDHYFINGQETSIRQILQSAPSHNDRVRIVPAPDSRIGAEQDLERALDNAAIYWESLTPQPAR